MSVMWFSSLQVCRFNLDHRELFRKQERQQAAKQKDTKSGSKSGHNLVESASTVTKWRSRISTILDLFKMSKIRDFPISYVHLHTSFFAIPLPSPQPPMTLSLESRGPKNNNPLQVLTKVTAVGRHRHWNSHFIIFHPFHAILPLTVGSVQFFFAMFVCMVNPLLTMSENDV